LGFGGLSILFTRHQLFLPLYNREKIKKMATVILNTRSAEAKKMLEFLKSTRYAKVIEDKIVNDETRLALNDIENGKVNSYDSVNHLISSWKK
jgi:hypothetical protein